MKVRVPSLVVAVVLVATAFAGSTGPARAQTTCPPRDPTPPTTTIAANFPTAIAFAPDGRLFWAERSGTVREWLNGAPRIFATVSTVTTEPGGGYSERGLLGLAVSPTFANDHFVYAFYSDADYTTQHVIRWTDCGGRGFNPQIIVTVPSGSDCCHKGGRIAFAPDGTLFVSLGDEHTASAAQSTSDVRGKILRYNADGSIPLNNPFGPTNPVWAYGLRNPFGLAVAPNGQVGFTNNGPSGDAGAPATGYDTVVANAVRGAGYQWPLCYGYSHPIPPNTSCGGQRGPDWSSERSTVVPTGAVFVDSSGPAIARGHFVFCTFNVGMRILTPGTPHATVAPGPSTCTLDVKQARDHSLYYSDTGHIYRLS
jgi:glucose/arabinose dehydrogenase